LRTSNSAVLEFEKTKSRRVSEKRNSALPR
jgi:hypothetical protein